MLSFCCDTSDNSLDSTTQFNKKWISSLVYTDDKESKLLNASPEIPIKIPQKFCYYYSQHELETYIVPKWKALKNILIEETTYNVATFRQVFYKFSKLPGSIPTGKTETVSVKDILITSCVHAREVATVTSTIAFIDNLLTRNSPLLDYYNFHVCFILNPRGYAYDRAYTDTNTMVNKNGKSYRKNGNSTLSEALTVSKNLGVDLNRNAYNKSLRNSYIKNFGTVPRDYKEYYLFEQRSDLTADTYSGESPNSEIEIQNFIDYNKSKNFFLYIDVHAYANDILAESATDIKSPSGYKFPVTLTQVQAKYRELECRFADEAKAKNASKGSRREDFITFHSNAADLGYLCYGCINDYLCYEYLENNKTLNTFTFEIGNDKYDRFYPSECEMVDIVYNFNKSMTKILEYYRFL